MDSLAECMTESMVLKVLQQLKEHSTHSSPAGEEKMIALRAAYDQAMERIMSQGKGIKSVAVRVLP